MTKTELMDRASSLACLLECLSEVDTNNEAVLQGMPQALKLVSECAETIFAAIANDDTG